jgi:hypothetical protein
MTATWSSEHSAIYRSLHLCLAMANDLSLEIGVIRINQKVIVMQLEYQFNSYHLMHIQESQLRYKWIINSMMVVRCTGSYLGLARSYRPRLVLPPVVPRALAPHGLS